MTPILHSPSSGLPYAVGPVETKEIDLQIRTLFDKMGLKWYSGVSYLTKTHWDYHKSDTAYCPAKGMYDRLNFYQSRPDEYTLISVTDFISQNTESTPKRGDWVMVGYSEPPEFKRIFLAEIEGGEWPYACAHEEDEAKFQKGEKVRTVLWKFMAPIVEPERVEPTIPDDEPESLIGRKVDWLNEVQTFVSTIAGDEIQRLQAAALILQFIRFFTKTLIPEPTNNRRALLENPELLPLLYDFVKRFHIDGPVESAVDPIKHFIASELSILDPKI